MLRCAVAKGAKPASFPAATLTLLAVAVLVVAVLVIALLAVTVLVVALTVVAVLVIAVLGVAVVVVALLAIAVLVIALLVIACAANVKLQVASADAGVQGLSTVSRCCMQTTGLKTEYKAQHLFCFRMRNQGPVATSQQCAPGVHHAPHGHVLCEPCELP